MADRSGYIGRAPGDSSVIIARQTFEPTGVQTNFTFASGYDPGYLDLYLNGIRLIEGSDYNATDGSVVGLTSEAQNGDVVEAIAYKAFNVAAVSGSTGAFTVGTNLVVNQTTTLTGDTTAANINSSGIVTATTGDFTNISVGDVNSTGVVTATSFSGDGSNLTGVSGFGTALSNTAGALLNNIFKTPFAQTVAAGTSIRVDSDATSGGTAFTRLGQIHVAVGATFHVGSGTTLTMDVLRIFHKN